MKTKLITATLLLGGMTVFAQTTDSTATATDSTATATTTETAQEKFVEIAQAELPEAVKTALQKTYPEAVLEKAYVNEKKEYKLEIKSGDQTTTVYADAEGNWINK